MVKSFRSLCLHPSQARLTEWNPCVVGAVTHTLIAALGGRVLVPKEELDFLFARPPLLQVVVHHVLQGNGSLCRGEEETLISYHCVAGDGD